MNSVVPTSPLPAEIPSASPVFLDDPELILQLINNGELNITTADVNGELPSLQTRPDDTPSNKVNNAEKTTCDGATNNLWNLAIEYIFMPKTITTKSPPSSSVRTKRNTSHRLLTSNEILAEKLDIQKKKEQKEKARGRIKQWGDKPNLTFEIWVKSVHEKHYKKYGCLRIFRCAIQTVG